MDYKERIEAAKEQLKAADAVEYKLPDSAHAIRTAVYAIYPELRESEDERIRKEILQSIRDNMVVIHKDECIAWLEKQVSPDIVADAYLRGCNDTEKKLLEKQGEQKHYSQMEKCINCQFNYTGYCNGTCILGEGKVEPKFKVGNWVVQGDSILKIKCVGNEYYCWEGVGGYVDDMLISELDSQYHLWTIQDAKAGDVLTAHECYVIFKEIDGLNIKCYCTYHYMNNPSFHVDTLHNKDAFHPATKEQRDLLFSKMHEAGYTFDFEKKKLNHIEQNNEMVEALRTEYEKGRADAFAQMQKEWSEEDENKIDTIIQIYHPSKKITNWLKNLKDRYTWKPSDEQMEALKQAKTDACGKPYFNALASLYVNLH